MIVKKLNELSSEDLKVLLSREIGIQDVLQRVNDIVMDVAENGDEALRRYTEQFDGVRLESFRVSDDEIEEAYDAVDESLLRSLELAAQNIYAFHDEERTKDLWLYQVAPGVVAGQKVVPLESVGAYVPGGRAAYPSSALMCVIPAKVAGVERMVVCTPPDRSGRISPLTLAAADIAGADEIYKLGGAQAIAAMALGTESIERVEKIVGPGNIYVTAAKMLVRGSVEIDFPAGPSEVLIIADSSADPEFVAADMIAQAEHDPSSIAVVVTTSEPLAKAIETEIPSQIEKAERRDIVQASLERCAILLAESLDDALAFSNAFAPEHLELMVRDPMDALNLVRSAGSVFLGHYTPVAAGDYATGTNHVLPTAGYARIFSGLNIDAFTKKISIQSMTADGLESLADAIIKMAESEGLRAHAESVRIRMRR
ncbi:MAG: histidinol dehydrogenase [Methanothrix sp.]|jgi:histidinol dehydrogenase (EC 1.1.1.23)|uniref:Histidinol dehydrogenase n=1 Tax=Methanothrix thermoacetophila (strain DSM 6194 / JCM 14653 / NBRC 101360 / PT) TaxID=349307 RepID=A0B7F8_METTP|nr:MULTISPECIES: histidinol dehydrogenase [Methanothrix]ABK14632.1 histidinol dehydrogenase [Methanothrix thermoacetophila PT]MBC7079098.1 histidinol dehydrogenase [Methanothrix sp.]NPU87254.1 histidinol dehydrogenase [Methanothrix sp.]